MLDDVTRQTEQVAPLRHAICRWQSCLRRVRQRENVQKRNTSRTTRGERLAGETLGQVQQNAQARCFGFAVGQHAKQMLQRRDVVVQPAVVDVDERRRQIVRQTQLRHLVKVETLRMGRV